MHKKLLSLVFVFVCFLPFYAHADITTGLTTWLKMDDGSGTTAVDSSGSGNSATTAGGPSWASGHIGTGSLSFDGSDDRARISPGVSVTTFTLSSWFKTSNGAQSTWRTILNKQNGGDWSQRNYWFGLSAGYCSNYGELIILYSVGGTGDVGRLCSGVRLDDNSWHHGAATYDGTTLKIYVDGVLAGSQTVSAPDQVSNDTYVGMYGDGSTLAFPGNLDDVRIYNRALSGSDISDLYAYNGAAGAPATGSALRGWAWSETFGWISFNSSDVGAGGGPYNVAVDSSGNFSGYAWSENLGWLSFNAADVTSNCSGFAAPNLNFTTGKVTGGIYAKVYGTSADGCIKLSDTNHASPDLTGNGGVSVDMSTGQFKGFAWGGDVGGGSVGPGWIQFNPGIGVGVSCVDAGCTGGSTINGTCTPITAYTNIAPNTSVTFQGAGTSGTGPYQYSWNGTAYTSTNTFSAVYSSTAPGPNLIVKDSTAAVTSTISCPAVTVQVPLGPSSVKIGKTVATANGTSLNAKQRGPFALVWNMSLSDDYTCSPTITPDPNNADWNTYWKGISLNQVNNGNGTKTWSGNTGTTLTAGSVAHPVNPNIYQFGISCTSLTNSPQSTSASLKVSNSSENEI